MAMESKTTNKNEARQKRKKKTEKRGQTLNEGRFLEEHKSEKGE